MYQKPELLSPAGDAAALRAAVCAGADAVYLGYSAFGARASAVNFDDEALEQAVRYAHLYHVRVHVTVNTLIKQRELEGVYEALKVISRCGADAVLVQDMGVALLVRECFPQLKLHASTQMALCDSYGARFAKEFGFDRVVLARECPIEEIKRVCDTGIETEVFVHGALCAGVSGQCLMSSLSGGRSGNRGRCAQPCRQQVTLDGDSKAFLSMRDLMLRDKLPALIAAGVRSLKIEGRLKRPEYVSVVTESYRNAIDQIASGRFDGTDEQEKTNLLQAYHRGGFTVGHAFHAQDAELACVDRVGHGGVVIGRIASARSGFATLRLTRALHDGDMLQIRGREDGELRYSGQNKQAGEDATLRLRDDLTARAGDEVARLTDSAQDERARAMTEQPIPVSLYARVFPNEPMTLTASDGTLAVTATGEAAQAPRTRALTQEDVRKQLVKLGDTPFTLESVDMELGEAFAATSAVNALRRDALCKLQEERIRLFAGRDLTLDPPPMPDTTSLSFDGKRAPRLIARTRDASACQALRNAGADRVVYAPEDYTDLEAALSKLPERFTLELAPQMFTPDLDRALAFVKENKARIDRVALGSVGQLGIDWPVPVMLLGSVPVCNRLAAMALCKWDIDGFLCWPELSWQELNDMDLSDAPRALTVYGRETTMLLGHCPARVKLGLRSGHESCRLCDAGDSRALRGKELRDRKGYAFPLARTRLERGCVVSVLGALPTDLGKHLDKLRLLGAGALLRFTTESRDEQIAVTERFCKLLSGEAAPSGGGETTTGRFLRGVE